MKVDNKNGVVLYGINEYLKTLSANDVRVYWHSICRTLHALFIDRYAYRQALITARKIPNYPSLSLEAIYYNLCIVNDQIERYRDILFKIRKYAQHKRIKIK